VLRDARFVATTATSGLSIEKLIVQILGETPHRPARGALVARPDDPALEISTLAVPGLVSDFTLTARPGVVYGIAGQLGSGASDVLRALAGLHPSATGRVFLGEQPVGRDEPTSRLRSGVMFISNDRKNEGLFLEKTVGENFTSTRLRNLSRFGFVARNREKQQRDALADLSGISRDRLSGRVDGLSGGNQQKVFVARALARTDAKVLLIDEPTRGVDIGGRAAIHELLRDAASSGMIVIFASTELEELIELGDVIVTMKDGRIVRRHDGDIRGAELMRDMTHDVVEAS
jgi:ABC-type sugar transport system ATPase subunit